MSRLNYRHLYYFWRVATEGNLTQVANAIPVSQSALSSQIKQLEDYFDSPLFVRQGRRLELSEAGQKVLLYANDIFARGEELEALRQVGLSSDIQLLRVGVLTTLSRNFIDGVLAPLLQDPNIQLSVVTDNLDGLLEGLAKHQLDVALTNADVKGSDQQIWQSQLIARRRVSIVGPIDGCPGSKFPDGYRDKAWVLPNRDHEIRRAFEGLCARYQMEPRVKAESNDMAMLRLLARNSGALSVLPTVVVRDEIASGLLQEYERLPNLFGDFYAITVRRKYVLPALLTALSSTESDILESE